MKTTMMSKAALSGGALVLMSTLSSNALAESPMCGEPQDESWIQPEMVQERVETLGYTIDGMAISEGNCYEVTGLNVQGESVVTYVDPRTGDIVQEEVAQ